MYRAYVFDLFGTLVEPFSKEDYQEQLDRMSYNLGIEKEIFTKYWNKETYNKRMLGTYSTIEDNLKDICARLGRETDIKSITKASNIRMEYAKMSISTLRENKE